MLSKLEKDFHPGASTQHWAAVRTLGHGNDETLRAYLHVPESVGARERLEERRRF
jgi:hypothetical protein